MKYESCRWYLLGIAVFCFGIATVSCENEQDRRKSFFVPAGYYATLDIMVGSRMFRFGPFVGYYFRPRDPAHLDKLDFLCFNEQGFYTEDLPADTLLFSGSAKLATLPAATFKKPSTNARIVPVFEGSIPKKWLDTRPEPLAEYRHFHSAHDDQGASMTGYWLRHVGEVEFTYDMGGRVGQDSPLHHEVMPGVDLQFPLIVEFDHGPG